MRKHLLALAAVACLAAAPASATFYNWNLSGGGYAYGAANSGLLDCADNGDGTCTIDYIGGFIGGNPIVGFDAGYGIFGSVPDCIMYPDGRLTAAGCSFQSDNGSLFGINWNLSFDDHYDHFGQITSAFLLTNDVNNPFGNNLGDAISFNVRLFGSPAPEPASWAMMLCGFGLVGSAMRRRRAQVTFA